MRIWILKASEPTPYDAQVRGSRLFRYGMLTQRAVELGHEVVWWTDDFDHFHKAHRFGEDQQVEPYSGCVVQFIHTPGYEKNASPSRFLDHKILARRFEEMADAHARPDVILAGMPTDRFCVSGVRVGRRYGVPVVLDVRDLWPDVFYQQVPAALRPLLWLVARSFDRRVRWAFARADAIIGNTAPFVEWGLEKAGRSWGATDRVVPIGYRAPKLTDEQLARGHAFWREQGVRPEDGVFTICFFGSVGPMYDFEPVLEAARTLRGDQKPVRFVLCGKGSQLEALRQSAAGLDSVFLPGWVNVEQIASLMQMSHLGLAPYRDDPNFRMNLPNKPAEYLSASLPYLIGIDGVMHDLVREHQCGQRYGSAEGLVRAVRTYRDDTDRLSRESRNAYQVYRQQLDAQVVYSDLVEHLASLNRDADKLA